jgi:hypothetical protein
MESECSLPFPEEAVTLLYPETDEFSPEHSTIFPKIYSNINIPSKSTLSEWSLPFRLSKQNNI